MSRQIMEASGVTDITLRDYQTKSIEDIRAAMRRHKRILFVLPTGGGKTIVAGFILKALLTAGNLGVFLAHRRELIIQCHAKMTDLNLWSDMLMAGMDWDFNAPIQVCSIQTIESRVFKRKQFELPPAKLVIVDESHRSLSKGYRKVIDAYVKEGAWVLGITATPCLASGVGLGWVYDEMVKGPTVRELMDQGHLVEPIYYAPSVPDLHGVAIHGGDYVESQLGEAMNKPQLVGDTIEQWQRICPDRQTIMFASGVKHSMALTESLQGEGVNAVHMDAHTPGAERREMIQGLKTGDVQVICNCAVLIEGFDAPAVSCVVLARPTKSLGLYLQMAGRLLRPYPGKDDCILIDQAGAVYEHGPVDQDIPWTLSKKRKIKDTLLDIRGRPPKSITCKECACLFSGVLKCPQCGHVHEPKGKHVTYLDGNLERVEKGLMNEKKVAEPTLVDKQQFCRELNWIANEHHYKTGWVYHKLMTRFKLNAFPSDVQPILESGETSRPSGATTRWITSQNIRYHKRRIA